jgi:dihydroflavonol-4-reductase
MKVLVLGATGHIGNAIVRELLSRKQYSVTCTGRRREMPPVLRGLPVRYVSGNHDEPGQIEAWIAGHELVVDAAAPYPVSLFDQSGNAGYSSIDSAIERTQALIEAALQNNATLAYVSSFTTLKQKPNGVEQWPARLARELHPYFAIKQTIEDQIIDAAQWGLRAVIVNPTLCLGPWDTRDRRLTLIPLLLSGEIPGSVAHNLNVIDVREVAAGLVSAARSYRYAMPMLFSGHNISAQALFRWICELGGVPPPRLTAPMAIAAFGSFWLERLYGMTGLQPPISSLAPLLMYQHEWMPPAAALRDLNVTVRPLYETLLDSIEWYRSIGYC